MSNEINILNDVTKTLIDSQKGYEKCIEVADDSYALRNNFRERAVRRSQLIQEFQNEIRILGGEPATDGSVTGKAHRAWTEFTTLFQDDEKAAVEAIDDGEEHLAKKIESKLDDDGLSMRSRQLLSKAHADAREGERFADMVEDAL